MDDYRDKIEAGESGFLKFMTKIIPGYGGYREKEMRREADRLLREAIMSRLDRAEKALAKLRGDFNPISQGGPLLKTEQLITRLETLTDRLRYAKYGYSGAFAAIKIDADKLDQLYTYDETLIKNAESILEATQVGSGNAEDTLVKTAASLDELEAALDRRERLLMEE